MQRSGITQISVVNALGADLLDVARRVLSGESGLGSNEDDLAWRACTGRFRAHLPELPDAQARYSSRASRLLALAFRAIASDVARAIAEYGASRVAIVLGSSTGGIDASERAFGELVATGELPLRYSFFDQHTFDSLARVLGELSGATGPSYVVSTACSSSSKALGAAQRLLAADLADAVIAGGADGLSRFTLAGFRALGILSAEPAKPFSQDSQGINLGEGSALFLLERQARTRLYLAAAGESSDAHHATAPHPEGLGAILAMRRALDLAEVEAEEVDYVNAHGTGTRLNDLAESQAIWELFSARTPVSSIKDRTGHLLGTAGASEAAVLAACFELGELPANAQARRHESMPEVRLLEERTEIRPRVALKNSFGFGGSNASLVLTSERGAGASKASRKRILLRQVAFWARGYPTPEALRERRRGALELPRAELLPERARGRASLLTRIFAELAAELGGVGQPLPAPRHATLPDLATIPTVYASAYGEMTTTVALLEMLWDGRGELSPARFQASVHNSGASALSIACGNHAFSTSIAAGRETFAMGLVEALSWLYVHGGEVLLLCADEDAPARLAPGGRHEAMGIGLHLGTADGVDSVGAIAELGSIRREDCVLSPGERAFESLPPELLENPVAAGLPLIAFLTQGFSGAGPSSALSVALAASGTARYVLEATPLGARG